MTSSATNTESTPAPAPGCYHVDPRRTTVRFTARHLFGLGRVSGTFELRAAELTVGDPITDTTLNAVLDAASFASGDPRRDAKVRSATYLDTVAHPDITFTGRSIHRQDENWVAAGTVTAHGVQGPAEVTVHHLARSRGEVSFRASAKIDRYAHAVTAGKGLAGRWLTLDIAAVAIRVPDAP